MALSRGIIISRRLCAECRRLSDSLPHSITPSLFQLPRFSLFAVLRAPFSPHVIVVGRGMESFDA